MFRCCHVVCLYVCTAGYKHCLPGDDTEVWPESVELLVEALEERWELCCRRKCIQEVQGALRLDAFSSVWSRFVSASVSRVCSSQCALFMPPATATAISVFQIKSIQFKNYKLNCTRLGCYCLDAITKANPSEAICFNHSTSRDHHLLIHLTYRAKNRDEVKRECKSSDPLFLRRY